MASSLPCALCIAVQEEGQFMVTFPSAYHGGFNQGFNCAEAVNFAPADWLRFGAASTERYRSFRKPSVVSHEQLLMKVRSWALPFFAGIPTSARHCSSRQVHDASMTPRMVYTSF